MIVKTRDFIRTNEKNIDSFESPSRNLPSSGGFKFFPRAPKIFSVSLFFGMLLGFSASILVLLSNPGLIVERSGITRDGFTREEFGLLREGDLILRKGIGLPSDLIVQSLGEGLGISHAAIVLVEADTSVLGVLQSLNGSLTGQDGVQWQDIKSFNLQSEKDSLVVLRPKMSEEVLFRFLEKSRLSLKANLPFDNRYDKKNREALYCSELLVDLFVQSGWWPYEEPVLMSGPIISFATFLQAGHFELILSHNPRIKNTR